MAKHACPFCGSPDTVRETPFGTSLMVARHYCRACRSFFENIKWGDRGAALDLPEFLTPDVDHSHRKGRGSAD